MKGQTVDGSKVTLDTAKLLLENEVEESSVELADLGGGGGHRHGLLSSP